MCNIGRSGSGRAGKQEKRKDGEKTIYEANEVWRDLRLERDEMQSGRRHSGKAMQWWPNHC